MPNHFFPPMPELGHSEQYYKLKAVDAEKAHSPHAREAAKVGQYVTLAMNPALTWAEKQKYFTHAIKRHCVPPPYPDDEVWVFYQALADLVRSNAGAEALRLASVEGWEPGQPLPY